MKNKKLLSLIVIVCIIAVIGGIAVFKNAQDSKNSGMVQRDAAAETLPGSNQANSLDSQTAGSEDNGFALEVESIDLDALKSLGLPIIIDFGADECAPCRQMAPALEQVNAQMQGKALIKFIDIWQNPDGFAGFPIQLIPTQAFFDADGNPYVPSKDIDIDLILYHDKTTDEHVFTLHQGGLTTEQMLSILADMGVA